MTSIQLKSLLALLKIKNVLLNTIIHQQIWMNFGLKYKLSALKFRTGSLEFWSKVCQNEKKYHKSQRSLDKMLKILILFNMQKWMHTYIIGHYTPSVRITHFVCVNFICEWWDPPSAYFYLFHKNA